MRSSLLAKPKLTGMLYSIPVMLALGVANAAEPTGQIVPDTFTAKTTAMTPSDAGLKIAVRSWSDDDARKAVLEALSSDADAQMALRELPTVGYVWQSGSAVGYSLKYAYESKTDQGDRVTFVTDRAIGSFGLTPWTLEGSGTAASQYSVIELYLDGNGAGTGNLSLAADLKLETSDSTVSLTPKAGVTPVLKDAKREPKPYWAK